MATQRHLGPYMLLYQISTGGMAEIYRAHSTVEDGLHVAIKRPLAMYNEDEEFILMLTDEARVTSQINHENIVRVIEFGVSNGQHFLAMEFVDGVDFRRLLKRLAARLERLPIEVATHVVLEVLKGLEAAHSQTDREGVPLQIVHRDVTPSNVLVAYDGRVKLTDFGIAKDRFTRSRTQAGFIKGKLKYMSPEQTRHEPLDARSDVFSVGCILYLATTGRLPFEGEGADVILEAVRHHDPPPPSLLNNGLDTDFDALMYRALHKDLSGRFCSAEAMRSALADWCRQREIGDGQAGLVRTMRRLFSQDKLEEARRYSRSVKDDDPTPVTEVASYTRLVGLDATGFRRG
ncbi:MAG: serine/threonine-protein kinase [Myxococcota bacterium]|nr:serine/threonine-protein kinase [Myxococcota bacterium]